MSKEQVEKKGSKEPRNADAEVKRRKGKHPTQDFDCERKPSVKNSDM